MSGLRITRTPSDCSHMRSQIAPARNNTNTLYEFPRNQVYMLVLFYCSNTNIRESIVIYVLN
jgi:hypothetical protein